MCSVRELKSVALNIVKLQELNDMEPLSSLKSELFLDEPVCEQPHVLFLSFALELHEIEFLGHI